MTSRQLFEYALIELNKVQAPSLLLEDYNYFINKAINQYINKMYNLYDVNQQKSDDLRVLKSTAVLTPAITTDYGTSSLLTKVCEVDLPDDYLHVLNCIVEYTVKKAFKCYNSGSTVHFGAKRLTADMFSQIINNYYMRPEYKRPYYYINNVNISNSYPTFDENNSIFNSDNYISIINDNDYSSGLNAGLFKYPLFGSNIMRYLNITSKVTPTKIMGTFTLNQHSGLQNIDINSNSDFISNGFKVGNLIHLPTGPDKVLAKIVSVSKYSITIEALDDELSNPTDLYLFKDVYVMDSVPSYSIKTSDNRYGNSNKVRMEIRYGKNNSVFEVSKIYIDYLKTPKYLILTQDQIDEVEDNSQILEFPDYVCQEIVNELIKLLMENASDPRLQTNIPINQSIANPQQGQAK